MTFAATTMMLALLMTGPSYRRTSAEPERRSCYKPAAFETIASTLSLDSVGYEAELNSMGDRDSTWWCAFRLDGTQTRSRADAHVDLLELVRGKLGQGLCVFIAGRSLRVSSPFLC
jgi:hypothetical protein